MGSRAASAAAVALVLLGCAPKPVQRFSVATAPAQQGRIVRNVEFSGVLVPNHTVNIFAKLAGQATTVAADVGDSVRAGQLLVQIDTKELNAQLAVAEAAAQGVGDQAVAVEERDGNGPPEPRDGPAVLRQDEDAAGHEGGHAEPAG